MKIPFNLHYKSEKEFQELLKEDFIPFEVKAKNAEYLIYYFDFENLSHTQKAMLLLCIRHIGRKEGVREAKKIVSEEFNKHK